MAEQEQLLAKLASPSEAPDIQLCFSNLNLPPHLIAVGGKVTHQRILDEINGNGELYPGMYYEVTPTRRLAIDSLLGKFSGLHEERRRFTERVHQTWPQGLLRGIVDAPSVRSAAINAIAYLIMPETRRSLKTMRRLSHQLGGVPAVVYADQKDSNGQLTNFADLSFMNATQLSPELLAATSERNNFRHCHDSLWRRRVHGVIIDNHHLVRASDTDPEARLDWEQVLDQVEEAGTNVMGVHASAGRMDSKHEADRGRSQEELAAVFEGPDAIRETLMGRVLIQGYEIWRGQRAHKNLPKSRFEESAAARESYLEHYKDSGGALQWEQYFCAIAEDPIEAQVREENIYRQVLHGPSGSLSKFPVTIETPYMGMQAYRGEKRLSTSELVSMHRDAAQSWLEFFRGVRQAYDRTHAQI